MVQPAPDQSDDAENDAPAVERPLSRLEVYEKQVEVYISGDERVAPEVLLYMEALCSDTSTELGYCVQLLKVCTHQIACMAVSMAPSSTNT